MRRVLALAAAGVFLCGLVGAAYAIPPPRPGLVDPLTQRYRTSGKKVPVFPTEVRTLRPSPRGGRVPLASSRAAVRAGERPLAVDTQAEPSIRPLVLLIDFADRQASSSPSISDPTAFDTLFFGAGASDLSVRNYWNEVSYETFAIQRPSGAGSNPDIVGWLRAGGTAPGRFPSTITLSSQIADVNVANVRQLIADAVAYLPVLYPGFDFSPYVRASDGTFNAVIVVHPGTGQEDSGLTGVDPYSHTARIVPIATAAGDIVDYTIVPAKQYFSDPTPGTNPSDDPRVGVGVIVHEMGHLLGLPDLYPTQSFGQVSDNVFSGAGVFDLMAYGMWGSDLLLRPDVPAHLSAWSKFFLGWLAPSRVDLSSPRSLRPVEIYAEADKVYSNTSNDPTQYFLVENREPGSSLGSWLFDKFIPMAGALIWQVDEYVIDGHLATNDVNSNPAFRGVYVKEADGGNEMGQSIPGTGTPNDLAKYFGQQSDYFILPAQLFDRTSPSDAKMNATPIVDNTFTFHPADLGGQVQMTLFSRAAGTNVIDYVVNISGGGPAVAAWKTYNVASTAPPKYPEGMRSDDILSIAFDSGNNVWMGTRTRGIARFLGTTFRILNTLDGLPAGTPPAEAAPVQAMAFEKQSGAMWVGTDRGLFRMRDSGSGFRVLSSLTETSAGNRKLPAGTGSIRAISVRGGFTSGSNPVDIKYAATPQGVIRVNDLDTDSDPVDPISVILRLDATALAVDDGGTAGAADDVIWVGDSSGRLFRSLLPGADGGPADADPTFDAQFKLMATLAGNRITSLAVDRKGRVWIGTDFQGVQAFDLRETLPTPPNTNLRDPLRFDPSGDGVAPAYLNVSRGLASNRVTSIAFQATADTDAVAWFGHLQDGSANPGGVSRFDANTANDNGTIIDERVTVFRPEAGIPPENQVNGPASTSVAAAAADGAGNVWFGTTVPGAAGASRFGNAGIVTLDSSNYVNTSAIATVIVLDDGLNVDDTVRDVVVVRVTSASDAAGFPLLLTETGVGTGVFQGTFGFTNGASDPAASPPLLQVSTGNEVTVTYTDFSPLGVRKATATWKKVYPFDDSLFIDNFRCFIATAAFGSAMAPEVAILRSFRDRVLLALPGGSTFVEGYYRLSPPLARFIAGSRTLRAGARFLLVPSAMLARTAVGTTLPEKIGIVLFLGAFAVLGLLLPLRHGKSATRSARNVG